MAGFPIPFVLSQSPSAFVDVTEVFFDLPGITNWTFSAAISAFLGIYEPHVFVRDAGGTPASVKWTAVLAGDQLRGEHPGVLAPVTWEINGQVLWVGSSFGPVRYPQSGNVVV